MIRTVASKIAWVGRTASMVFGLALVLALVFGALSVAAAHTGVDARLFHLAHNNFTTALTTLTGNVNGPAMQVVNNNADANDTALSLNVQSGEAPMKVNSGTKVANLNGDKLDGKDAAQIGINGLQRVFESSAENSVSRKEVTAICPSGKVLVGTGFDIFGAKRGTEPNQRTDVVMDVVFAGSTAVTVAAYEVNGTTNNWHVTAIAICATAP